MVLMKAEGRFGLSVDNGSSECEETTLQPSDKSTTNKVNNEAAPPPWCVKAVNIH